MATKKDIDVIKIKITWDYFAKRVDIHSRNFLQYFAILLTFCLGVILAIITNKCDFWIALPFIAILLISLYLIILKIQSYGKKLRTALDELLDELDKLK